MNLPQWDLSPNLPIAVTSESLKHALKLFGEIVTERLVVLALRIGMGERHELPKFCEELSRGAGLEEAKIVMATSRHGNERIVEHLMRECPEPLVILNGESLDRKTQGHLCTYFATATQRPASYVLIVTTLEHRELLASDKWGESFSSTLSGRISIEPIGQRPADWVKLISEISREACDHSPDARQIAQVVKLFDSRGSRSLSELIRITVREFENVPKKRKGKSPARAIRATEDIASS